MRKAIFLVFYLVIGLLLGVWETATSQESPNTTTTPITAANVDQLTLLGHLSGGGYGVIMGENSQNALTGLGVWNLTTFDQYSFPEKTTPIAMSPDGSNVVLHDWINQRLFLWNLASQEQTLVAPSYINRQVKHFIYFSPDSRLLVVLTDDQQPLQIWDLQTGTVKITLAETGPYNLDGYRLWNDFERVLFSPSGKYLAIMDGATVRLWEVETGTRLALLSDFNNGFYEGNHGAFSPDEKWFVWQGPEGYTFWDIATQTSVLALPQTLLPFHFSPSGNAFILYEPDSYSYTNGAAYLLDNLDAENLTYTTLIDDGRLTISNLAQTRLLFLNSTSNLYEFVNLDTGEMIAKHELASFHNSQIMEPLSPQGNFAFLSQDNQYSIIDLRTGETTRLQGLSYPNNFSYEFVFSPDESLVLTYWDDRTTDTAYWTIWDVSTGEQVGRVWGGQPHSEYDSDEEYSLRFSPDGSLILVYDPSLGVLVYGIPTEERIAQPAAGGRVAATAINLYAEPNPNAPVLATIEGTVEATGRSSDGEYLYLASHEGWVRSASSYVHLMGGMPAEMLPILESTPAPTEVALLPTLLPTPQATPTLPATTVPEVSPIIEIREPLNQSPPSLDPMGDLTPLTIETLEDIRLVGVTAGNHYLFTQDGQTLVTADWGEFTVWDTARLTPRAHFTAFPPLDDLRPESCVFLEEIYPAKVLHVRVGYYDTHSQWECRGSSTGLWNLQTGEPIILFQSGERSVSFSSNGRFMIYMDQEKLAHVWDLEQEQELFTTLLVRDFRSFVLSPDSRLLVMSAESDDRSRQVNILELSTGNLLYQFQIPQLDDIWGIRNFTPDSQAVLVDTYRDGIEVWEIATGELRYKVETVDHFVTYTPDNTAFVTFGWETGNLRLWDVETGQERGEFRFQVSDYFFSPNGQFLVTIHEAYQDNTLMNQVKIWEVDTGLEIPLNFPDLYASADYRFSPDSRFLIGFRGEAVVWDIAQNKATNLALPSLPIPYSALDQENSLISWFKDHTSNLPLATQINFDLGQATSMSALTPFRMSVNRNNRDQRVPTVELAAFLPDEQGQPYLLPTGYPDLYFPQAIDRFINPSLSPDGTTLVIPYHDILMFFGIPSLNRPAWQPISGSIHSSGISLRANPDPDADILGTVSGDVLVGGQVNGYYYLPNEQGWVRGEKGYVDLGEFDRRNLPILLQLP